MIVSNEKSAIVRFSPAIHFDFDRNESMTIKLSVTLSRACWETFLTPEYNTGRYKYANILILIINSIFK